MLQPKPKIALYTTFIVVAAGLMCMGFLLPRTTAMQHARNIVAENLSQVLKAPVTVDRVEMTLAGNFRLQRVKVTRANDDARVTAQAGDIVVDFSLWRYLRTGDALSAITRIRVHSLELDAKGSLAALRGLVSSQENSGNSILPFPVRVSDALIRWQSYTWKERLLTITPPSSAGQTAGITLSRSSLTGPNVPGLLMLSGTGTLYPKGLQDMAWRISAPTGSVQVSGGMVWSEQGQWNLRVDAKQAVLDPWIGANSPQPLDFSAWVSGPLMSPHINITTGPMVWQGWRADSIRTEVDLSSDKVNIVSLVAKRQKAVVSAKGSVALSPTHPVLLDVQATDVTPSVVAILPASWPLTGTGSFHGRLTGPWQALRLNGKVRVQQGKLWQTAFTDMQADINANANVFVFDNGSALLPGDRTPTYHFAGNYKYAGRYLDMEVTSPSVPAAAALAWPRLAWPVEGMVQGKVRMNGPLNRLVYAIGVTSASGSIWGQSFRDLALTLEYSMGTTQIRSASAKTAGGKLQVSGDINAGKVNVSFLATDTSLGQLLQSGIAQARQYAPKLVASLQQIEKLKPAGVSTLDGTLRGPLNALVLSTHVKVHSTRLAGVNAGTWEGRLTGSLGSATPPGATWQLNNGKVTLGEGSTTVSGSWATAGTKAGKNATAVAGVAQRLPLSQAVPLVQAISHAMEYAGLPAQVATELMGSTITGDWSIHHGVSEKKMPQLAADVTLSGRMAGYAYNARLAGSGSAHSADIQRIQINAAGGTANLRGSLNAGAIRIMGTWSDLPAAVVGAIGGIPQRLSGILSGSIDVISGSGTSQGTLIWQSSEIKVGDSRLSGLSGRVKTEGGVLKLEQWRGLAANRTVSVDGLIPMPAKLAGIMGVRPSERYDLTVTIPPGPLAPLAGWLQLFPSTRGSVASLAHVQAQGEARLHVSGTAKMPKFTGLAGFSHGTVALPAPWGNLASAEGQLEFTGSTIKIAQASAQLLGGKVTAQGDVNFRPGSSPVLKGRVSGNLQPKIAGLNAEGTVQFTIGGTLADPLVSGAVDIRKADVNVTDLAVKAPGGKGSQGPNAKLDIDLQLRQLRLKANSILDMPASGTLKLMGTLREPALSGQVRADRGRVYYLGTNFTVEEATADFTPYRGYWPAISLWGSTWAGRTAIALRVNGVLPELRVSLGSEPPMSQAEILALLEWPEQIDRLSSGNTGEVARSIVEVLQGSIQLQLMGGLEDLVRESLGLDEFRLEPDLSERRIRLSAGKYVLPQVYLSYGRSLFAAPEEDLNLEYHLDNGWKVSAGVRDGNEVRLGVETRIRF